MGASTEPAKHIFLFYDEILGAHTDRQTEEEGKAHFEPREKSLTTGRP